MLVETFFFSNYANLVELHKSIFGVYENLNKPRKTEIPSWFNEVAALWPFHFAWHSNRMASQQNIYIWDLIWKCHLNWILSWDLRDTIFCCCCCHIKHRRIVIQTEYINHTKSETKPDLTWQSKCHLFFEVTNRVKKKMF